MSKYIVKLTPQGKYFFGGEMTFETGNESFDEKFSSYIIHSLTMPQQTSLLGMLRFLLLSNSEDMFDKRKNQIKKDMKDRVDDLIGKWSFTVNEGHERNCYGKIKSIWPCCLYDTKNNKYYFKAVKKHGLTVSFKATPPKEVTLNGIAIDVPEIPEYSAKEGLSDFFISSSEDGEVKKACCIFKEDSRIGIRKDYEGKNKNREGAFYKQISYRLDDGFCFAFEVDTDNSIDLTCYNGSIVNVGADDSKFLFEAKPSDGALKYLEDGDETSVVLLSDAYLPCVLDEDEDKGVRFAITKTKPFRFLSTKNCDDAHNYNVRYYRIRSPKRYDLYEAGSVFYFRDEKNRSEFCKYIKSFAEFYQIGYNRYCETK